MHILGFHLLIMKIIALYIIISPWEILLFIFLSAVSVKHRVSYKPYR